ncbi:MAG: HD domain-containing protein [Candidatus Micrarchaeota archaeon]|nr:HD domain-containing protein [Candidatus Micrarchaeota archaeon]MDE1848377.1 HD domain-containing protein [Candidatus Micrarchaeota archaeon]MDE1864979.1 HD domain-containing protein [Candidatus Micrarchaeota archaeon]
MKESEIIAKTAEYVKSRLLGEVTGHDWWHVYRVWQNALQISRHEKGVDMLVVQLGALLHDIADYKFHGGSTDKGVRIATKLLRRLGLDQQATGKICQIISEISFKGAGVRDRMSSKEGEIVQGADRLDAIGAIGIARVFAYGGYKDRPIYDPDEKPVYHKSFESYFNGKSTSINHFHEKLLLLRRRMKTRSGREMAAERDRYMRAYLRRFFLEWKGRK